MKTKAVFWEHDDILSKKTPLKIEEKSEFFQPNWRKTHIKSQIVDNHKYVSKSKQFPEAITSSFMFFHKL